jgi:hypothetical protein
VVLVDEVLVREGDGPEVMDLPMNVVDVDGVREDFLEPGGWMKNLLAVMALRIFVVCVVE